MDLMKSPRKLLILLLAASAALVSLVSVALAWPRILAEYHCLRVERAATYGEARLCLEAMALEARRPEVAEAVAGKLGPERQELTYRFFRALDEVLADRVVSGASPSRLGPLLPVVRAFSRRAKLEPELLGLWIHYQRWGGDIEDQMSRILVHRYSQVIVESFSILSPVVIVEEEPDLKETRRLLQDLRMCGLAWFWGMPSIPEVSNPVDGEKKISAWVKEHSAHLRFHQTLGCFVLDSEEDAEEPPSKLEIPPRPATPFPSWRGAPPER
jgi:hypothetical protein